MPEENDEFQRRVSETFEFDRLVRSHIIYEAVSLEGLVEQIIAWHFCQDETKHLWFQSLLFREGEIPFSKKIRILKKILQTSYPDIHERVAGLTKRLDKIRTLRNTLAHSELVLDDDKLIGGEPRGIYLRSVKNGEVIEEFVSKEQADEIVQDQNQFKLIMVCVYLEIKNRATGKEQSLLGAIEELTRVFPGGVGSTKK